MWSSPSFSGKWVETRYLVCLEHQLFQKQNLQEEFQQSIVFEFLIEENVNQFNIRTARFWLTNAHDPNFVIHCKGIDSAWTKLQEHLPISPEFVCVSFGETTNNTHTHTQKNK
jgi:hypothetical protein